jgi:transposase-like protein
MTREEIESRFPGELDAIMYFEHLRWGDAVKCSYCNTEKISKRQVDHRFHCSQCRKTFSVTTGTNLHSSKLPLKIWLQAFSLSASGEKNIPIKYLQTELKVSYTTAWRIRHGIREVMKDGTSDKEANENVFDYLCRKAVAEYKPELENAIV